MTFITNNESELILIAKYILNIFDKKPILLVGEIGSGKTTLVRKICEILNIKDNVKSPTFNKMNIYDNKVVHIDAYNLNEGIEIFEDYFEDKIIIIEWANLINNYFKDYIIVNFEIDKNKKHIIVVNKIESE